jgi:hypothetical protein
LGGVSDDDGSSDEQDFVPLENMGALVAVFDHFFNIYRRNPNGEGGEVEEPRENAQVDGVVGMEEEEEENWDNPSPTVPSRVELFLEAHPTGKDLCFSDAEMVMCGILELLK